MSWSSYVVNPFTHAIGLEFSDSAIKAVNLQRRGSRSVVVKHAVSQTLPDGTIQNGNLLVKKNLTAGLQSMIKAHLPRTGLRSAFVVLPERHCFVKKIEVRVQAQDDLGEAVRWEAAQHIPFDVNDLLLDWVKLPSAAKATTVNVLIAAVPKTVAQPYIDAIESAGLEVLAVEPASLAVLRLLDRPDLPATSAALYLGERESFMMIIERGIPTLTSQIAQTTYALENRLQEQLSVSPEDAKQARVLLGVAEDRALGVVRKALKPELTQLIERVKEILDFFSDRASGTEGAVTEMAVCGPGSSTVGIAETLTQELSMQVHIATLPKYIKIPKKLSKLEVFAFDYPLALGGALKSVIASA